MEPSSRKPVNCPVCHRWFAPRKAHRLYCSRRCSLALANASRCEQIATAKQGLAQAVASAMDALAAAGQAGELAEDDRQSEDPKVYLPTEVQIAVGCEVVRSGWPDGEAETRSRWAVSSCLVLRRQILYRHNGRPVVVS